MWNYPPSRILVPVDFGDASRRAVEVAGLLAGRFTAGLHLLHVEAFDAPAYFTHDQTVAVGRQLTAARRFADRHVSEFVGHLIDVPFSVSVVPGAPATSIVEAARSADLVVMGTHGRHGPSRWWLGSVAERVVSATPIPLLVVRAPSRNEAAEAIFKRPLMIAGARGCEGDAAQYATGLAQAFGGEIAPSAATCEADVARERAATLMVIAKHSGASTWLDAPEERLLRRCALAMLFVPPRAQQPVVEAPV